MSLTLEHVIFESALYSKWKNVLHDEDGDELHKTLQQMVAEYDERAELYCIHCKAKRIFAADKAVYDVNSVINPLSNSPKITNKSALYKTFRCSGSDEHVRIYGFIPDGEMLVKISEYPSKYDSVQGDFNKYEKILSDEKVKELAKAAQLESFGYALAAFLYYRRIYEYIVFTSFKNATIENKITNDEFKLKRMDEKIEYLKGYLPDYFKENAQLYSILSKGIHELEEKECREYLPIARAVLYYSLDEALDNRNKRIRKDELSKQVKEITSILKKPGS